MSLLPSHSIGKSGKLIVGRGNEEKRDFPKRLASTVEIDREHIFFSRGSIAFSCNHIYAFDKSTFTKKIKNVFKV